MPYLGWKPHIFTGVLIVKTNSNVKSGVVRLLLIPVTPINQLHQKYIINLSLFVIFNCLLSEDKVSVMRRNVYCRKIMLGVTHWKQSRDLITLRRISCVFEFMEFNHRLVSWKGNHH